MRDLILSDAAKADVRAIAEFIADQSANRDTADHFIDNLLTRCLRLAELPGTLGTARPDLRADLRSVPHRGYVIFFRYVGDTVEIVNIFHGRMDVLAHYQPENE